MVDEEHKAGPEAMPSVGFGVDPERPKIHKAAGAFRTISEVADELHVPQHVLRFWESKFPQVRPLKRGGGRRYYRPEDVLLLRRVADLLYTQGYTIKGVQRLLRDTVGAASLASAGEKREQQPPAKNGQASLPEQTSFEESFYPEDELIAEEELRESVMVAPDNSSADHSSMNADESFDEVKFLRALLAETLLSLEKLRQTLV